MMNKFFVYIVLKKVSSVILIKKIKKGFYCQKSVVIIKINGLFAIEEPRI